MARVRVRGDNKILQVGLAVLSVISFTAAWYALRRPRKKVQRYPVIRLKNAQGMEVHICPVGAAITRMLVPDAKGHVADVVLGYDKPEDYLNADPTFYLGVIVGRVANRIANAQFSLGGKTHKLMANNGPNALHGGVLGLHRRVWQMAQSDKDLNSVTLHYDSPAGEEGYPGSMHITVTYRLAQDKNELTCDIRAVTDEATPGDCPKRHQGRCSSVATIPGQPLIFRVWQQAQQAHFPTADHYTPVGSTQIPTGEILPVAGTPFDFSTAPHTIAERMDQVSGGYDHNYVLFNQGPQARFITKNGMASLKPKLAASITDPKSGRCLEVFTTAPGMQFYTGNYLDETIVGKAHTKYYKHAGLCLETQGFPDAVNQPNFPSAVLQPDETYKHTIVYKFSNKTK